MNRRLRTLWRFIRSLAMDDAYDRYLRRHAQAHTDETPLDRRAFYLSEQQRKWTGVSRCC
jgi:uncharacterized short protein YbdD (DUF466 family)